MRPAGSPVAGPQALPSAPPIPERGPVVSGINVVIIGLLLYLFATLPFAVVDNSLALSVFNRSLLLAVGALCLLSKRYFDLSRPGAPVVVTLILAHTAFSMLQAGSTDYFREVAVLFALASIVVWARTAPLRPLVMGIIVIALFYCVDVMVQYYRGVDFFGFVPRNNRIWGAFYYGAPTFGTFLSFVVFAPLYFIRRVALRLAVLSVFLVSMVIANDRAPVLQTAVALMIFAPVRRRSKLLLAAMILAPAMIVSAMDPLTSNRVVALYRGVYLLVMARGSDEFAQFLSAYGFQGYFELWAAIATGWFRWDNLFNVLFGTGWGSVLDALRGVSEYSRPHSSHMDVMVCWGLVGYALILWFLFRTWRRHRMTFLLLAPAALPFSSFSLTSANYLFMMCIAAVLFVGASRTSRQPQRRRAAAGARHPATFRAPDASAPA